MAVVPAPGMDAEIGLDVESEIEVLAHAPLQGRWQAPAELVRLLLARGAERVEVDVGIRHFRAVGWGAKVDAADLERLALVLDGGTASDRHAAVLELEATEAMPLLWAASAGGTRWRFAVAGVAGSTVISGSAGRPVHVEGGPATTAPRVVLELWGRGLERGRAVAWLRSVCRFARIPVLLAGVELGVGHREGAFRARLPRPLPCDVAIGTDGDGPALWLLRHGVVTARAAVPGYPPFHAAVEMAEVTGPCASPAEARTAVQPFLTDLIAATVGLMVRAAVHLPSLAEGRRRSLTLALLQAASLGIRRDEILELPLAPLGELGGGRSGWRSLSELARGDGQLPAASEEELRRLGVTGRRASRVLRLGPEERELVLRLTGRCLSPPPAASTGRGGAWLLRVLRGPAVVLGGLRVMARRPVPESELTADETRLVATILRWLEGPSGGVDVAFVAGTGPPAAVGDRLRLPRHDPVVAAAVRACAAGEGYPALLSLAPRGWTVDPAFGDAWRSGAAVSR